MALKLYDSKDAVPADQREKALETKDGKWAAEEIDPNAVSAAAQATIDKVRKEKKEEKERADAEKVRADALEAAAAAAASGVTREQLDKINADAEKKFKPVVDENAQLKGKLRKVLLGDRLEARLLKAGVMPDRVAKAVKDLDGRVDLTDDGEDFVVNDAKGKVTSETLDDFLSKTYKTEAPFFYAGTGGSGSGADGSSGGGGGGGGYDPVAAGKALATEQKKSAASNADAFR